MADIKPFIENNYNVWVDEENDTIEENNILFSISPTNKELEQKIINEINTNLVKPYCDEIKLLYDIETNTLKPYCLYLRETDTSISKIYDVPDKVINEFISETDIQHIKQELENTFGVLDGFPTFYNDGIEKELFSNDYFTVIATGNTEFDDFAAIIKNNSNSKICISFTDANFEDIEIEKNGEFGIYADTDGYVAINELRVGSYEMKLLELSYNEEER